MKRINTIMLMMSCCMFAMAQDIVVESFTLQETDVTANIAQTTVLDKNGQKCALLKVETTISDLLFDVGTEGVQKVEAKEGEVWVYVPAGVGRITIMKNGLAPLENYDLGQRVESAKTYLLKLKSINDVTNQKLTIKSNPLTAAFVITPLSTSGAKPFVVQNNAGIDSQTLEMPVGEYKYMALAQGYNIEEGTVEVVQGKDRNLSVELTPIGTTSISFVDNADTPTNEPAPAVGMVANDAVKDLVFAPFHFKTEPNEMIIGKTKLSELRTRKRKFKGLTSAVNMKGMTGYDFMAASYAADGTIELMGVGYGNPLPQVWTDYGLNWDMNVQQWTDRLEELGFILDEVKSVKAAMVKEFHYNIFFSADKEYGVIMMYNESDRVQIPAIGKSSNIIAQRNLLESAL